MESGNIELQPDAPRDEFPRLADELLVADGKYTWPEHDNVHKGWDSGVRWKIPALLILIAALAWLGWRHHHRQAVLERLETAATRYTVAYCYGPNYEKVEMRIRYDDVREEACRIFGYNNVWVERIHAGVTSQIAECVQQQMRARRGN